MSILTELKNMTPEERKELRELLEATEGDTKKEQKKYGGNRRKRKKTSETKNHNQMSGGARRIQRSENKRREVKKYNSIEHHLGKEGVPSRPKPLNITGENKFLKMKEYRSEKKDTKIDKLLWGDNKPEEPRPEVEYIEISCNRCGDLYEVHPKLVFNQDGELRYTCDVCNRRKGG